MPFAAAAPIIASVVGGGLGILGGAMNGKSKTSTSSTTPTLSPEMKALQDRLSAYSTSLMDDPNQGIAPIRQQGLDNINRTYMGIPSRISSSLASRGYGNSGDMGGQMYKAEYQRGGAIGDFESQIAQLVNANRNKGADLGQRLLSSGQGSTSTSTGPDTSFGDALQSTGNGLGNLSTLFTLNKLLKGGGGGGGVTNFDPYGGYQGSVTGPGSGIGGL